jgi:hypothetical protein
VESEGHVGAGDVVVDRLRHADDRESLAREAMGSTQRAVAADDDERIDRVLPERSPHAGIAVAMHVRIDAGRTENRPAALQDAAHAVAVETPRPALHQPLPAVQHPNHLEPMCADRAGDDAADHRVQAGAVATGGEDAEHLHGLTLVRHGCSPRLQSWHVQMPCPTEAGHEGTGRQYKNIGLPATCRTFGT